MAEEKLKIALLDPVGGHGGMDFYDYGLSQGLAQNDVEVFYFTAKETQERKYPRVTTFDTFGELWSLQGTQKIKCLATGYWKAFRLAKKSGCQHVHFQFFHLGIQNSCALLMAKTFGFKTIITLHDVDSFRKKENAFLQKLGYWLADKTIVHNQLSKTELLKKKPDLQNVQVVPHGNYKPFVPTFPLRESDGVLKLLFFGQIKDVKGLEILLQALKKVLEKTDRIHLSIVGKPWANEKYDYPAIISELGLDPFVTTRFEYVPNDEVAPYFKACDLVVLPYKRIYQSGVLLLAMSYGRAVVASDLPAFKEIITDKKTGFLFENGNSEHLTETILALSDRKLLGEVQKNANTLLDDRFDWKKIGNQTKTIYGNS